MFCNSLRRRESCASILKSLTSPSSLSLRESDLKTHDISLPLNSATGNTRSARQLRVLLLSPSTMSDQKLPSTIERIRRFASLTGGQDLAIIFLLYPNSDTTEETGMAAYAKLQAEMMNHSEIPSIAVLPLPKLEGLPDLLKSHQAALSGPPAPKIKESGVTSFDLLRQCSNMPPMSESAAFMLTDLFTDLRGVADACTPASTTRRLNSPSAGLDGTQTMVDPSMYHDDDGNHTANRDDERLRSFRELAGEDQYQDLLDFWTVEFAA